jgi:FdhE protein
MQKERSAIERAKEEHQDLIDVLELLENLVEISQDDSIIDSTPEDSPAGSSDLALRLSDGFPLADEKTVPLSIENAHARFGRVVEILTVRNPEAGLRIIEVFQDPQRFTSLLDTALPGESGLIDPEDDTEPLILLAAYETLRPAFDFLWNIARTRHADALANWSESFCPICGARPNFSFIEQEENRRLLFCSRCSARWGFSRITCPFCGEADHRKLRYFQVEDDETHRVYVCDTCSHYIKTVLGESDTHVHARLQDLLTLPLDAVARREGYRRDTLDLLGILLLDLPESERS